MVLFIEGLYFWFLVKLAKTVQQIRLYYTVCGSKEILSLTNADHYPRKLHEFHQAQYLIWLLLKVMMISAVNPNDEKGYKLYYTNENKTPPGRAFDA